MDCDAQSSHSIDFDRLLSDSDGMDSDGFMRIRDFEYANELTTFVAHRDVSGPMNTAALSAVLERVSREAHVCLRPAQIVLPWERGILAQGRHDLTRRLDDIFRRPVNMTMPQPAHVSTTAAAEHERALVLKQAVFPMALRRVRDLSISFSTDQLREKALKRMLLIVQCNPEASGIGRTMLREIALLKTDAALIALMKDFFAKKSTATLNKRAGSILRYIHWCHKRSVVAFPLEEARSYEYCKDIEASDAKSASTVASFRQAVGFMKFAMEVDGCQSTLGSTRIAGVSHNMLLTKAPLQQRKPYTTRQIWLLEAICCKGGHVADRILAGHILFCVYARARWGDHQSIEQLLWDLAPDGSGFVQGNTRNAKTSVTAAQRTRFLPLTAPLRHLGPREWWQAWRHDREAENLEVGPGIPFLPAPDAKGGWSNRALTTGEAGSWSRELLRAMGNDAEGTGAHSCKVCLLSWMAKYGAEESVRLMLGYHVGSSKDTMLHYSRDALSGPLRALNQMLSDVIKGKFSPDSTRSGYFTCAPANQDPYAEPSPKTPKLSSQPTAKHAVRPPFLAPRDDEDVLFGDGVAGGVTAEVADVQAECVGGGMGDAEETGFVGEERAEEEDCVRDEGSANGDSEATSSSESDSDDEAEAITQVIKTGSDKQQASKNPASSTGSELYVHVRLGTLHKGKTVDATKFACGRVRHSGHKLVDDPKFGWSCCAVCFGS